MKAKCLKPQVETKSQEFKGFISNIEPDTANNTFYQE